MENIIRIKNVKENFKNSKLFKNDCCQTLYIVLAKNTLFFYNSHSVASSSTTKNLYFVVYRMISTKHV